MNVGSLCWLTPYQQLTHAQNCVESATQSYERFKKALSNTPSSANAYAEECFWFLVISHFSDPDSISGCTTLDLELPKMIDRTIGDLREKVIFPKMREIALSNDAAQKAELVEELRFILMHGVFHIESSRTIRPHILRVVFEVEHFPFLAEKVRSTREEWLPKHGFEPREAEEEAKAWYWPCASLQTA